MMDDLCAPQWADFTSNSQLPSDSYFEVEHEVHEPLAQPKLSKPKVRLPDKIQVCMNQKAKVTNECAKVVKLPKIAFFVPCGDNTKNITQATTLDSVPDEVKNLQICAKARHSNLSISLQGKKNSQTESEQKPDYADNINKTICGNFASKYLLSEYHVEPVDIRGNIITEAEEEESETHLVPDQSPKSANIEINKRLSYKIIRRQSNNRIQRQSNAVRIKQSSLTNSGPRVLTSQYRRRSLNKYRRRTNQFISLAEAVTKFHTATPDRFRTLSQKDIKSAANSKIKRMSPKLTFPVSPALRCKNRTRTAAVITKEQQELKELEETKKHQIKTKPVPAGLLKAPAPLKKIGKKPSTVTEKFSLTQCKKHQTAPNIIEKKHEISVVKPLINEKNGARVRSKTIELNTDKRAKERHVFDEKLKKKAEEEELKRQEEEKHRLENEKLVRAQLRKKAEIKARPMPVYKQLLILKSTKPLTDPKSPGRARKLKSKDVC